MKKTTLRQWKRDGLEIKYDYAGVHEEEGRLIRQLAGRIADMASLMLQNYYPSEKEINQNERDEDKSQS